MCGIPLIHKLKPACATDEPRWPLRGRIDKDECMKKAHTDTAPYQTDRHSPVPDRQTQPSTRLTDTAQYQTDTQTQPSSRQTQPSTRQTVIAQYQADRHSPVPGDRQTQPSTRQSRRTETNWFNRINMILPILPQEFSYKKKHTLLTVISTLIRPQVWVQGEVTPCSLLSFHQACVRVSNHCQTFGSQDSNQSSLS